VAAILSQELAANIFCADCELDHIHRCIIGAICAHRMARADFNVRRLARSLGVILRWRPCFFGVYSSLRALPERPLEKAPLAYPKRSLLRRDLDICSTSQNIVPKPTTTPKNSNVRPGTVNMVNIRDMKRCKLCTSEWRQKAA